MYICMHCGHEFEDIAAKNYDSSTGTWEEYCPNCGSEDFEEAAHCDECDEWFPCDEVVGRLCDKCLKKHINEDTVFKYGDARKQGVELNGFLAYVYEPDEIEHILTEHFKSMWKDRRKELVEDHCSDDLGDFSEWLTDESEELV